MKTYEEIKQILKDTGVRRIPVHNCSMCGYPCGYIISELESDHIDYDSRCDCTNYSNLQPSSIKDIVDWYNMQESDEAKKSIMKALGVDQHEEEEGR